jgi:DNA polymerase V
MIGLADCNSFYASCEKLFRPDLRNSPVVVLSNNDGCIVALSSEAKALGIQRGMAYFKCKDTLAGINASVFSSNYTLYQDISDRTVDILKMFADDVEPYSIDESFFTVPAKMDYTDYAMRLHNTLRRRTGLMISVGIARTKTLAKIANHIGKKQQGWHYLAQADEEQVLGQTPIGDVWGVGWRYENKMLHYGIRTALDLARKPDEWIKRNFSVTGLRTACELRGQMCISEDDQKRRSFASGISFAEPKTEYAQIEQTISCHCEVLSRKLVDNGFAASGVFVQILTNRFLDGFYYGAADASLEQPSCYAPALMAGARKALDQAFRPGLKYKASRVGVFDLSPISEHQWSLFDTEQDRIRSEKEDRIARLAASDGSLSCLTSAMLRKGEICQRGMMSPRYTTRWTDLPTVN